MKYSFKFDDVARVKKQDDFYNGAVGTIVGISWNYATNQSKTYYKIVFKSGTGHIAQSSYSEDELEKV
jgi:hypothetical protein